MMNACLLKRERSGEKKAVMFDPHETPWATCRLSLPINSNKMGNAEKLCFRDEWYVFRHTESRVNFMFWWILSKQTNPVLYTSHQRNLMFLEMS